MKINQFVMLVLGAVLGASFVGSQLGAQQGIEGGIEGGSGGSSGPVDLADAMAVEGILARANGGTGLDASADDRVMVGNGTIWEAKAIGDCDDTGGNHINYDTATNTFSCGTSSSGGGGGETFFAQKTMDLERTNNTTADDPELVIADVPAGDWYVQLFIRANTSATPGMKMSVRTEAGETSGSTVAPSFCNVGGLASMVNTASTLLTDTALNISTLFNATNESYCMFEGPLTTDATGDFAVQWAQQTTNATAARLRLGSWLRISPR